MSNQVPDIIRDVVSGGYCVGCGVCVAAAAGLKIVFNGSRYEVGVANADVAVANNATFAKVCPFSNQSPDETTHSDKLFGEISYDNRLGRYRDIYGGYVKTAGYRKGGSSGGMASWILAELLKAGLVDGVIHVKEKVKNEPLFTYEISLSEEAVRAGQKSRYYPIEMSEVLNSIRLMPGRYAIVGVPCFIKAVRSLAEIDEEIRSKIAFTVGLVCGHLKTAYFAKLLAWQAEIPPSDLASIDFRVKVEGSPSSRYAFRATDSRSGENRTRMMSEIIGGDWGLGFFKLKACDFCDDVFAETADIVVGDAWLPRYEKDSEGTNIVVVRNARLSQMIQHGIAAGDLELERLSVEDACASQHSGLMHRREGLSWRLAEAHKLGTGYVPRKRVAPGSVEVSRRRARIYRMREQLRDKYVAAFEKAIAKGQIAVFFREMQPLIKKYSALYSPWYRRIGRVLKRIARGAYKCVRP